jgi:hypothetical protein
MWQSGISLGVASLLSTWLLLSVVFFMYAACAVTFFSKNDPYHFGSIAMSMWTFFEMSTLDVSPHSYVAIICMCVDACVVLLSLSWAGVGGCPVHQHVRL